MKITKKLTLALLGGGLFLSACLPQLPFNQALAPRPLAQIRAQNHADTFKLLPQTKILTAESPSQPQQVFPDHLVFQGRQSFLPGEVLMGRARDGQDFLRKVHSVQASDSLTRVNTIEASLFEAFEELDVQMAPARAQERIDLGKIRFRIGPLLSEARIRLDADFSDTQIRLKDKRLFLRVVPVLNLNTDFTHSLDLLSSTSYDLIPIPIGEFGFKAVTIPTFIGPVPITFNITPSASLALASRAQGQVLFNSLLNGTVKTGVELEAAFGEDPSYKTFWENPSYDADLKNPRLELQGQARSRLHIPQVQVDTKIAGMVGPYVKAGTYLEGYVSHKATVKPDGTLVERALHSHVGLTLHAGITETKIFGKKLARGIHKRILDKKIKEIYRQEDKDFIPHPKP